MIKEKSIGWDWANSIVSLPNWNNVDNISTQNS